MKIFVSYTTRNNEVDLESLGDISLKLNPFGKTFIDLIHNNALNKQERIIYELENADLVVLIKTPSVKHSAWVKFELEEAKRHNTPIIQFSLNELKNINNEYLREKLLVIKSIDENQI